MSEADPCTEAALQVHRVAAGVYETADGKHRILRVIHEGNGPRGGNDILWEHSQLGSYGWEIVGVLGYTLREAKRVLATQFRGCPDGGTCHHRCTGKCWRVGSCAPLSSYGEDWTEADKAAHR